MAVRDESPIVDFAAHFHPKAVFPEPLRDWGVAPRVGSLLYDFDELGSLYERSGYDGAVLSQPFYMGRADLERVTTANDALLEHIDGEPYFYGLASIPTSAGGETAADEFERCLENGYHGGGIETKTDGVELTDVELEPIFEVADAWGAPLMVHPKLHESLHPGAFEDGYLSNAVFGREAALCESVYRVICEGIPERYPNVKLVYHHTGGNIASMLGRVELHLRSDWWPGQENLPSLSTFRTALDQVYVDTAGFAAHETPMRAALEAFPTENVLLGTDCPFEARTAEDMKQFVSTARAVTTGPDAERVLGQNTREILVNV